MLTRKRMIIMASVCIVILLLLRFLTSDRRPAPLTPKEQAIVGTWSHTSEDGGTVHTVTYHPDRTCTYHTVLMKDTPQWRMEENVLIIDTKYQTMLSIPAGVNLTLPSFASHVETQTFPVAISPGGDSMTIHHQQSSKSFVYNRVPEAEGFSRRRLSDR